MKNIKHNMGMTPKQIVAELDRFIVGQHDAKKAVAIALRNRYRRKYVEDSLKHEIVPKNILMIGPTGVGKTEIARRLAKLSGAPFIKVEATKFTEIGYVGRDVEGIIRDLADIAVNMFKNNAKSEIQTIAKNAALKTMLDTLVGKNASEETRAKFKEKILNKELDNTEIEIEVLDNAQSGSGAFEIPGMPGAAMGILNVKDMLGKAIGIEKRKVKTLLIKDALLVLQAEESEKLIDEDKIISEALRAVENDGMVFLDEIDKICSSNHEGKRGEVSREGVQRDLLPIIEGTVVNTKHGPVNTDHILFIASGAFHLSKPSDMLPELQGRLPIRVELKALSEDDMLKILKDTESSLIRQYKALIKTERVELEFEENALKKIAFYASHFNKEMENIGARRLHTIMEKLTEDISYEVSDMMDEKIVIDDFMVEDKLGKLTKDVDLAKFIL
jgi:ATP-dependent HslUV protease ATP-binding subunit HslU